MRAAADPTYSHGLRFKGHRIFLAAPPHVSLTGSTSFTVVETSGTIRQVTSFGLFALVSTREESESTRNLRSDRRLVTAVASRLYVLTKATNTLGSRHNFHFVGVKHRSTLLAVVMIFTRTHFCEPTGRYKGVIESAIGECLRGRELPAFPRFLRLTVCFSHPVYVFLCRMPVIRCCGGPVSYSANSSSHNLPRMNRLPLYIL